MKVRHFNENTGLVKTTKVSDQITLLVYNSRESLCAAFCRIEEHYESPEFRDKIFTLGQYREWYSKEFGAWSYYKDWSGFNIPAPAFRLFFSGHFDPLSPAEAEIIDLFKYKTGNFAVIGTFEGGDADVYEHEICHAMFATNVEYQLDVKAAIYRFYDEMAELREYLKDLGYNDFVIDDECHAYICESFAYLQEKKVSYPKDLTPILQQIKKQYRGDIK